MKRLSKEKCNGTLEGAALSSETGFIKIQFKKEEWNLESFDEKISTFSKDISKGKLILTLKETDLSYMYELKFEEKIEIKEEVKMTTTNIFEKERTLLGVDTYKNNEKFIEFESENERGVGLVKDGKVIIQGFNLDHYSIKYASVHDYVSFYNEEMKIRKVLKYPPYYNICLIRISGKDYKIVSTESNKIKKALERNLKSTIILGPSPCAIIRIKDTFRFVIILKYKKEDLLIETLEKIINHYRDNDKIIIDIDFNPNHF